MQILFIGSFILLCVIVGWLYWDKDREVRRLRYEAETEPFVAASAIFTHYSREKILDELRQITEQLEERGVHVCSTKEYKWGFEYVFDNLYTIYYCDARVQVPDLKAGLLLLDVDLTCEEVVEIFNKMQKYVHSVQLLAEDEEAV